MTINNSLVDDNMGKGGGSSTQEAKKEKLFVEYQENPEGFRLTTNALYMAYVAALGETHELHVANSSEKRREIVEASVERGELKGVFVELAHGGCHVHNYKIVATKNNGDAQGLRAEKSCDGIALSELIERVPAPE